LDQGAVKQIGSPNDVYEHQVDEFVANFVGHINLFPGEVIDISEERVTLKITQGNLRISLPPFEISIGDSLKAVVRPESIELVDAQSELRGEENVLERRIEVAMYIGSIIRYTISAGDQTVFVDQTDPQYKRKFQEGGKVKLILEKRIHLLRA
jgi:ABC-type Fe3+/spermidine/putrescine transport system ATPase subunit